MSDAPISPRMMGERRFGRVNWLGLQTLFMREVRRFLNVWTQTLLAPVATAGLFILVFALALGSRRGAVDGLPFEQFLAPGILMMTIIQNAFANTSSSILISKVQGNIVDTLMPPLSAGELVTGFVAGGVARGLLVSVAVAVAIFPVVGVGVAHPLWALVFVILGGSIMATLGVLAAIMAQKFDQLAALTNFLVTPLSFLSGTFYSIQILPEPLRLLSQGNPIFYMIDGMRYAVLGVSDASPWTGVLVLLVVNALLCGLALRWFRTGYRLKG